VSVKTKSWCAALVAFCLVTGLVAQAPTFTRPGTVAVVDLTGLVQVGGGAEERPIKPDELIRAEATLKTANRSAVTLEFSNGMLLQMGSRSELVLAEYWQQPHSQAAKLVDLKQEPSPSRTLLRLVSGDATVTLKPLLAARGSTFHLECVAGTVRATEGTFRARVQMTELGLGVFTLELRSGAAEFEPVGGAFTPVAVGRPLTFAVEVNRVTGNVKLGEMPKR
jgi:hypothetical protein